MKTIKPSLPDISSIKYLLDVFDDLDEIVYITDQENHKILYANQAAAKDFGKIVGLKCYKAIHGAGRPCADCTFRQLTGRNAKKVLIRERLNKKNGKWYHCIDRTIQWFNGKTAKCQIAVDITENKITENTLKESEEKFKMLAEQSPNMIVIHKGSRIVYVNRRFEEVFGYSRSEIYVPEFDYMKLVHHEHVEKVQGDITSHYNDRKGIRQTEHVFLNKKGEKIDAIVNSSMVKYGGVDAIMGVITDITKQKRTEKELVDSLEKLKSVLFGTVDALSLTSEKRDPYVAGHQRRVLGLSYAIAQEIKLTDDRINAVCIAANLHDIGKINVPIEILTKPSKLTETEFDMIKTHTKVSYDILKMIEFPWPVADIVLQHHERINGTGYPNGLLGKDITLEAKILAIADVVEAMAHHRPYRSALGIKKALNEIIKNKGILYDERVSDVCIRLFKEKKFKFK